MIAVKKEKQGMPVNSLIHNPMHQRAWGQGELRAVDLFCPDVDVGMAGSVGRQSPLSVSPPDTKPLLPPSTNPSFTNGSSPVSPSTRPFAVSPGGGNVGFQPGANNNPNNTSPPQYPPNHPLSGSKHLCSICGDRASGKHYGVYSCEGCKGFFKRTVRKELRYACRDSRNCLIDKRQRNRCQYCRYEKCLSMGMKREAVQEERHRTKEKNEVETSPTSSAVSDMPLSRIRDAELLVQPSDDALMVTDQESDVSKYCSATRKQLEQLVEWAKHIPHFRELPLEDQTVLLKAGWNELLIASFSHRSINVKDGIVLASGVMVDRNSAEHYGMSSIYDRVLSELVAKMREMKIDQTELGCLRSIVLYNPDTKGLVRVGEVEMLREKVYAVLEEYTKTTYPNEFSRFPQLLLRLPALRSIGLRCLDHLFFCKQMLGDMPIDKYLQEMLDDNRANNILSAS